MLTLWLPHTAEAASPASGTLGRSSTVVRWSGGPFVAFVPNYLGQSCPGGASDPTCDHFRLTVNLGEGAEVLVSITTPRSNPEDGAAPFDGDDYDLFVFAPSGAKVAAAEHATGNETIVFRHQARFNGRPYEVRVAPWLITPGSSYKGTVEALSFGA